MFRELHLTSAILVYDTRPRHEESHYYLEIHDVVEDENGTPRLSGGGKPLRKSDIKALVRHCSAGSFAASPQVYPSNLVWANPITNVCVWYRPAGKAKVLFDPRLDIPSGERAVPPLLFVAKDKHLGVYALAKNGRPTSGSRLLEAPFPNIDPAGGVCMGTARPPRQTSDYAQLIRQWEDAFWGACFNDHMAGRQVFADGTSLLEFWKSFTGEVFPTKTLLSHDRYKTVGAMLRSL